MPRRAELPDERPTEARSERRHHDRDRADRGDLSNSSPSPSEKEAPKGDSGGNDFCVRPSERAKNPASLHIFWDGLLGTSKNCRWAYNEALTIEKDLSRRSSPS